MQAVIVRHVPHVAGFAAEIQAGLAERGRTIEIVAITQLRISGCGIKRPAPCAIGIERIELTVAIAEINNVVQPIGRATDDGRRSNDIAGVILPEQRTIGPQRIQCAIS